MEDVTLHIVERPYSGFPDASSEGPEPTQGEARATEEPSGTGSDELIKSDQVNGVLVLSLLDKIIGAVDQIQLTQAQLEERQAEMEGAVQSIQGELSKLGKAHATTSNTVSKLLEKVRKVSVNVKTVRGSLERQAGQIKKLEVNEAELLRRRNFKVMIYQVSPRGGPRPELGVSLASPPTSRPPPGIRVGTPGRGSSLSQPGLVRAVRSSSLLPANPAGVGFQGVGNSWGSQRGASCAFLPRLLPLGLLSEKLAG